MLSLPLTKKKKNCGVVSYKHSLISLPLIVLSIHFIINNNIATSHFSQIKFGETMSKYSYYICYFFKFIVTQGNGQNSAVQNSKYHEYFDGAVAHSNPYIGIYLSTLDPRYTLCNYNYTNMTGIHIYMQYITYNTLLSNMNTIMNKQGFSAYRLFCSFCCSIIQYIYLYFVYFPLFIFIVMLFSSIFTSEFSFESAEFGLNLILIVRAVWKEKYRLSTLVHPSIDRLRRKFCIYLFSQHHTHQNIYELLTPRHYGSIY